MAGHGPYSSGRWPPRRPPGYDRRGARQRLRQGLLPTPRSLKEHGPEGDRGESEHPSDPSLARVLDPPRPGGNPPGPLFLPTRRAAEPSIASFEIGTSRSVSSFCPRKHFGQLYLHVRGTYYSWPPDAPRKSLRDDLPRSGPIINGRRALGALGDTRCTEIGTVL